MNIRSLSTLAAVSAAALFLSGCGGDAGGSGGEEGYSIGIAQYVTHPSLDRTREGFKDAFEEAGVQVEWDEQNAEADSGTNTGIAGGFASSGHDMVAGIATPSAQAVAQAVQDRPVVFMAVTDPVDAGLVESWETSGMNVTGVSDLNPVEDQLALVKEVAPDARTVGIVYSSGEANSVVQVEAAKAAAPGLGLEIKESTITNTAEVQQGVTALDGVDAIYVPTDNTVVSGLESVIGFAQEKQIPVISADRDSVERGTVITKGIDYYGHGKQAGEMALRILQEDLDPASVPVEKASDDGLELIVNEDAAKSLGVEIPKDLLDEAEKVTAEDAEESGN
ncbi:ABC transporter substrate-binding protein [Propioniferax innocua]|uniref:Putative ABC transport system substrate-binding protein n=1 Tax=Propioniferax innocua TaxID=1753 RepID=A0A542ZRH1_9ACTN|nr:ABC transporter substrate-binding protein [Propioniferax innocua]TQL62954.1 putative ABC transport system substrate-binding protein [Propioniferax innocua]